VSGLENSFSDELLDILRRQQKMNFQGLTPIVIVGGNAGGMTAAGRAARLNPDLDIVVLEQGPHVSYSICGAPYYLSGEVPRVESLISYTPETF
jgi:hypothetical protein